MRYECVYRGQYEEEIWMYTYILIAAKYIYIYIHISDSFFSLFRRRRKRERGRKKFFDIKKKKISDKTRKMIDEWLLTFEKIGYSSHLHNLNNRLIGRH